MTLTVDFMNIYILFNQAQIRISNRREQLADISDYKIFLIHKNLHDNHYRYTTLEGFCLLHKISLDKTS